jgi:hypothetical protein
MLEMLKLGVTGVVTGKLFTNPGFSYGMMGVGIAVTAAMCFGAWSLGFPLPLAAGVAAFLGGALQPRLLKNIRLA